MTTDAPFFDVVRTQRACRAFTDDPVSDDLVEHVLEAAGFAPSAENSQPWVFVVVRHAATRERIGDLTRRLWEQAGRAHSEGRLAPGLFADVERGATGGVSAAPVVVVVGADTTRCHPATVASSTFPAIQNLLLAANSVGLGSALTTLTATLAADLRAIVGLPEHVEPVAVVPLGRPARPLAPPRREPVAEHAHRERYGEGW
ncbi:MAG TPA: nitroreductase family protein [Acidimicrobiia bacterium]|nr:nitroreductase family protein [Acidimicrobiia bacterium]